jgi:hypothetical protein
MGQGGSSNCAPLSDNCGNLNRQPRVVKSELVFALNEKFPELLLVDVELALNCILEQMISTIAQGERIEI